MTVVPWLFLRLCHLLLGTQFQFSMLQDIIRRLSSCVEKARFIKNSLLSTSASQSRNDEHGLDIWYMPRICTPKILADTCTWMFAADREDWSACWDLLCRLEADSSLPAAMLIQFRKPVQKAIKYFASGLLYSHWCSGDASRIGYQLCKEESYVPMILHSIVNSC